MSSAVQTCWGRGFASALIVLMGSLLAPRVASGQG
jgi:hypothetical protein